MRDLLTKLSKARFPYEPLITVEISKCRLIHNLNEFRKLAPGGVIAPVLKSNAYGHGLLEVARILECARNRRYIGHNPKEFDLQSKLEKVSPLNSHSLPFFIVDSYFEAIRLRANRIRTPILVIGYTPPQTIDRARLRETSFTVTSLDTLRALARSDWPGWSYGNTGGGMIFGLPFFMRTHRIHVKIDTGMRRQGIMPEEVPEAISIIRENSLLSLEGICSHLADADNIDRTFSEEQVSIWNRVVKQWKAAFPKLKYIHLSQSDGHRYAKETDANVSRLGIGMYGLLDGTAFTPKLNLFPVLQMTSLITGSKLVKRGEPLGYGRSFRADRDMTVATIPVGYYEGLNRQLSNVGSVLVGPTRIPCRIVGRVSMNITIIDVTPVIAAAHLTKTTPLLVGAPAVAVSNMPADLNSLETMARTCNTISYELAVHIPAHLKRVVV